MRKVYFLLILVSVCLTMACRQVLPEDRMVDLLTDMYLYDEEFAKGVQDADSVSVYRSIFLRHGCGEEDYKKAIAYYVKKPKIMKEIYEAVKVRLEGYKAEFEQTLQVEDSLRNLWVSPYDTLFQSTGMPPHLYAFSIPVDTLCTYTLSVSVQHFDDDSTQRPHMKGYLFGKFGEKDTVQATAAQKTVVLKTAQPAIQRETKQLNREFLALEEVAPDLKIQENSKILESSKIQEDSKVRKKKNLKKGQAINKTIKTHVLDTVRQEKEVEFARGETKTYTMSFTVDDTLVTHIKGFWLLTDNRDSTAQQHIYLSKFRVHKPGNAQPLLILKPVQPLQHLQPVP